MGCATMLPLYSPGTGTVVRVVGAVPAVGADPVLAVPAGQRWRLMSVNALFIPDATVIDRRTDFEAFLTGDPAQQMVLSAPPFLIPASQITLLQGQAGSPTAIAEATLVPAVIAWGAFPGNFYLNPTDTIAFATVNLQAADFWNSGIVAVAESWPV